MSNEESIDPVVINLPVFATPTLPNLAGVATQELVQQIKSENSNFSASYINWSRTMQLLRDHAPGWLPELVLTDRGGVLHTAPIGGFLLIRFRHSDGRVTPEVPQAIMDARNNSVPLERITARDITDTHRRGACMAAAFTFGLAYELWAKMPLESGMEHGEQKPEQQKVPEDDDGSHDQTFVDWKSAIQGASTLSELSDFGKQIATSGLPESKLQKLRAAYDVRHKQLEKA